MSRDPKLKNARNRDIKDAYRKLQSETVTALNGKKEQKYRHTAMLAILSKRFYLAQDTIADILISDDEIEDKNQLDIFKPEA